MSTSPPSRNHILLPPPAHPPTKPVIVTFAAGQELVRIYNPSSHGQTELTFRTNGPRARFDHHRHPVTAPADDPPRGIWYGVPLDPMVDAPVPPAGRLEPLEVCCWECFGDTRRVDFDCRLARVRAKEDLSLLSLVNGDAAAAGSIAQIASTPNPDHSQAWSRYFYDDVAVYTLLDGLLYRSAWTGHPSVALYERAQPKLELSGFGSLPLRAAGLRAKIIAIADLRGWTYPTV